MSLLRTNFCVLHLLFLWVSTLANEKGTSFQLQQHNVPMSVDVINLKSTDNSDKHNKWLGRYLPDRSNGENYGSISRIITENEDFAVYSAPKQKKNMMTMGSMDINSTCDDGKTNLTRDWDGSFYNYTCMLKDFLPVSDIQPLLDRDLVPKYYVANHVCMKESISYNHDIPSFGSHRPAWARYGEYKFLPKQRWLHNLEHGSVVMLYHPCTHPVLVQRMRTVLKSCLFRHIITPYNLVPEDRPIVLVTWGNRLYMNDVDTKLATDYIKKYANHAKETTARDGQYDHLLIEAAELISPDDINICPTPHKRKNRI
uniref:Tumor protein p53-inducible protein 13 n=1 Tax=Schizaphis graminum TaxID=13262 RepID=A0A2S2N9C5_SCHGA